MSKFLRFLPLAAVLLLYFGGILQRPLFAPDEFHYAAGARQFATADRNGPAASELAPFRKYPGESLEPRQLHRLNALLVRCGGFRPWTLRLLPAAATLLTAGILLLFGRLRSAALGEQAALIYLGTLGVFAVGTAASALPLAALGIAAVILGGAGTILTRRRRIWYFPVIALAGILLLAVLGDWRRAPDFRRLELLALLPLGLLPGLILSPVIWRGLRGAPRREPALLTAGIGLAASVVIGIFQPAAGILSSLAFLSLPAAYGFNRYAELDPEGRRLNRLLRSYILLAALAAIGFLGVQLLGKFEKIPVQYILYDNFSSALIAVFAVVVMLFWWIWALKEPCCRRKLYGVLLGFGFVMLAGQQLLPSELIRRQALQRPLELFVGGGVTEDTVIAADAVFAPAACWTFYRMKNVFLHEPREEMGMDEYMEATGKNRHVIILRRGAAEPPERRADRKIYFRPADLLILEYLKR